MFLAAGGAGSSHRHRSEDLQHPREDGAPRPQRHHMSNPGNDVQAHTCIYLLTSRKISFFLCFSFFFVCVFIPIFFSFVFKWWLNWGCFISLKMENECCTLFSELSIDHRYLSALENFKYSASKPGRLFNYNYCKQQKHECADWLLMFVPCFYPDASTKGASRVIFFLFTCACFCVTVQSLLILLVPALLYTTQCFSFPAISCRSNPTLV